MRKHFYLHTNETPPIGNTPSSSELEGAKARLIACAEKSISGFLENRRYIDGNYQDLLKQYPDQWVAVYKQRVVASGPTLKGIFNKVDQMGICRGHIAGEFLDTNPKPMIL